MTKRVHIRWMIRRDMAEVLRIEGLCFERAWDEEDFRKLLRARNCIGLVAEINERVVGYMVYELHTKSIELLNFAVAPEHQRCGVGTALVQKIVNKLMSHGRIKFTLLLRESNLAAQLFFRSQQLKAVAVLRKHYADTGEDAYKMEYRLPNRVRLPRAAEENT